MAKYRKKPIVVTAEIADTPQYIATLEGISNVNVGDYIVTGIDNEQWAIKPKWFHGAYEHIKGNSYRRKPQILEAVQIHDPEVVKAPTGDIKGDPLDYKVTGTRGEQWFVKPDIFEKTYDKYPGTHKRGDTDTMKSIHDITFVRALPTEDVPLKNNIQKSIDQIGLEGVMRYLPKGMLLMNCDMHGKYLSHYSSKEHICPLCVQTGTGEGVTATEVEHLIDLREQYEEHNNEDEHE